MQTTHDTSAAEEATRPCEAHPERTSANARQQHDPTEDRRAVQRSQRTGGLFCLSLRCVPVGLTSRIFFVFLVHVCARAAQRRAWPSHTQTHHHARRPRTDAEIASDTPGRRRRTKAWWRLSIRASCFLCRVPARVITRGLPPSFERPRSRLIVLSWCMYRARRTGDGAAVVVVVLVASSF
jgi:hypothetical protein